MAGKIFPFANEANAETPHLSIHFEQPSAAAPYVILDTDYDNFSCIYSCMDFSGSFMADHMFIWSRSQQISWEHKKRCEDAFLRIGVNPARLQTVAQSESCDDDVAFKL